MSDPAKYRTREEVQEQRDHHDPIEGLKKTLLEAGKTEEELKAIDKAIRAEVATAADFAETSPEPAASELYTDVLVEEY
jgi:pyruvate dehydrogenase E1 component alpha subunit